MKDLPPEGSILISVRGLYDGCYIAKLPDGSYVNLVKEDDWRYPKIQEYLENVLLEGDV